MRVKNFAKFQHFKDRCPPWVKLYRDLLNDIEWFELDPKAAKVLVSLWLIASEDESREGNLPELKQLAFRLRISETELKSIVIKLSHWLEQDDINLISEEHQDDAPEKRQRREETESASPVGFAEFWSAYPKKVGKGAAEKAWKKAKANLDSVLAAIKVQASSDQWRKENGQYIPNPATWINERRWEDGVAGDDSVAGDPNELITLPNGRQMTRKAIEWERRMMA